jgi:hypothetical protein
MIYYKYITQKKLWFYFSKNFNLEIFLLLLLFRYTVYRGIHIVIEL